VSWADVVGMGGKVVDGMIERAVRLRAKRKYLRGSGLLSGMYSQGCDGKQLDGGYLPYRDCSASRKIDDSAFMPEAETVFPCLPMIIISLEVDGFCCIEISMKMMQQSIATIER
jgi:hypothetical protein